MIDSLGKRLAKRDNALSLRALRAAGQTPEKIRAQFPAARERAPSGAALPNYIGPCSRRRLSRLKSMATIAMNPAA